MPASPPFHFAPQPNWGFNADTNSGHASGIFMPAVGTLQPSASGAGSPGVRPSEKSMRQHLLIATLILLGANDSAHAADRVPNEAKAAVKKVHAASATRDLSTLRGLMLSEFTWSFGGDANASQAIEYWQEHPEALRALAHATQSACELQSSYVQCPKGAGKGYRAGFKLTVDGWRMAYFVAGD